MPRLYLPLEVDFDDDDKVSRLARYTKPGEARALRDLLVAMWRYCKRNATDGHVPLEQLGKLVYPDSPRIGTRDADRLVDVGLAERTDDGYYLPGYLKRNKSRAQLEAEAAVKAEAGRKGGKRSGEVRRGEANSQAEPEAAPKQSASSDDYDDDADSSILTSRRSRMTHQLSDDPGANPARTPANTAETRSTLLRTSEARDRDKDRDKNSTTSTGSLTATAGTIPRIIRSYVEACRDNGYPSPEESQARIERSARSLLNQGFSLDAITDAARNAAAGGWTDLATQLQRDAARAQPPPGARPSTTDQRAQAALTLADHLDRKAIG